MGTMTIAKSIAYFLLAGLFEIDKSIFLLATIDGIMND